MAFKDRKHKRIDTLNLISYNALDENGEVLTQGMGRTLNVSLGGFLIGTPSPIDSEYVMLMDIGFKDKVVNIKGKVIYSREGSEDKYESGVEFTDIGKNAQQALAKFIEAFQKMKENEKSD